MKGTITTYLPEKKYGFIKGDDGKDYFFHEDEFRDRNQIAKLCEEAFVAFDQQATPKGYKAKNCSLIEPSKIVSYATPNEFVVSRSNGVRGWDVLERGNWVVHGSSEESPDSARLDAIEAAKQVGANALLELEYYKTRGFEPGEGKGTHYFTIHNFRGRVATLAKRTSTGPFRADQLMGLNERAESLKKELAARAGASKRKRNIVWAAVIALSLASLNAAPGAIIVWVVAGFICGRSTDYGSWLQSG